METRLNVAGVPAARVRRLGEFLGEVREGDSVCVPGLQFEQDGRNVLTPGLGFRFLGEPPAARPGAERLGGSNEALMPVGACT